MPEQIQNLINRILEWWRKFTRRQQVLIVSIALVVAVAIAILVMVVSKPKFVYLATAEDATQATEIRSLLSGENIEYENTDIEGMKFTVKEEDYTNASLLLGSNKITVSGYTINDAIDGSFSTTEADKQKKYQLYLEDKFAKCLEDMSMVKTAKVNLSLPEKDGTIMASQKEGYASVTLKLTSAMSEDTAAGIAQYIATCIGNDSTTHINIMDTDGNVLFAGGDATTAAGKASSNQTIRDRTNNAFASQVRSILLASEYDNVEVAMNLKMNFDQQQIKDFHYYVDEGMTQGYLDSYDVLTSNSTSGVGGVPGTTSNDDDTTYVIQDGENSNTETNEEHFDYVPSETITEIVKEMGVIESEGSSASVVANKYKVYREADLKKNGTLDDMTFEEFIAQNSEKTVLEIPNNIYFAVAQATGVPQANISILAYEVPMFEYAQGSGRTVQDYLQIILAVLILAMLAFVVIRSLRRDEEEEDAVEEVTLEQLITEEEESNLTDIGYTEKSEARLLIEKFVDERPEAVAALLRNWLNEDWG